MNCLVTGATGFIGSHVTSALLARGDKIRVLTRSANKSIRFDDMNVETVRGNIKELRSLEPALDNVDVVFHCGGLVADWGPPHLFYECNVVGTRNVLEASLKAGISRVITISSLAVYGLKDHHGTDESAPFYKSGDPYSDSKIEAEKIICRYRHACNLPVTVIRPGFVYGPGDRKFVPKLLNSIRRGQFAFIGSPLNILNTIYIDDVVEAIILAATKEVAIGRSYNITDGSLTTCGEFVTTLAQLIGVKFTPKTVPYPIAYIACFVMESWKKLIRSSIPPKITKAAVKFAGTSRYFNTRLSTDELGFYPKIHYREGLIRTLTWLREEGLVGSGGTYGEKPATSNFLRGQI